MASELGRGAQVRLDGDVRQLARGGNALRLIDNIREKLEMEEAGTAPTGNNADGSLADGTAADDEVLVPGGAEAVFSFTQAGTGAVTRTVQAKLRERATVADFTAQGTGIADDTAAFATMAAAVGFICVPRGNFRVTSATIDVPLYFEPGGYISVDVGETFTIRNTVESDRQWIFRGSGSVAFSHSTATGAGEQARHCHISWFGAFPSNHVATDQSPTIQRACDAMGNTREAIIDFDMGNYYLGSTVTVWRGTWIRCSGIRRTVFHFISAGYDGFVAGGVCVRVSDCSFETLAVPHDTGACIRLGQLECEAFNIHCIGLAYNIVVTSSACRVDNISGAWGVAPAAGGSLVHVAATTNGTRVSNIMAGTSAFAPGAIVRVGGTGGGTVNGLLIENISYIAPATIGLHIDAASVSVSRVSVKGISYNGSGGTVPDWVAALTTTGTGSIADVSLGDIVAGSYATGGIKVSQNSTSSLKDVVIDRVTMAGTAGVGVLIEKVSGTLQDIFVGSAVNVLSYATPFSVTGDPTNVRIAAQVQANANAPICYSATLADDTALTIDLQRSIFASIAMLSTNFGGHFGIFSVRAASSPAVVAMATASANVNSTTGALAGTTGTDGKITVSAADKFIYVENRSGGSLSFNLALLAGA